MPETLVLPLGWEDPLEKRMATDSSILAWRIPWGSKELDTTEQLTLIFFAFSSGKEARRPACAQRGLLLRSEWLPPPSPWGELALACVSLQKGVSW